MKSSITLLIAAITFATPALARAATVELRNVYANVEVIPEDRADVSVDLRATDNRLPTPRITRSGGDVLVDGGLNRLHNCGGIEPGHSVRLPGIGWTPANSALKITLHTPATRGSSPAARSSATFTPPRRSTSAPMAAASGISPTSAAP